MLYNRTEKKGCGASHFLSTPVIVPGEHYLFLVAPFVRRTHWVPRRQWQNECEEIYSLSNVTVNSILFRLTIFDENNSNTLCIRL